MTPLPSGFDAVLCDLDNVVRFYDFSELTALERESGLMPGLTASVAYAPELDLPLLLGRIDVGRWTDAVARRMAAFVPPGRARELARAMTDAPFHADPEAVELLRRARELVPLVIVTNATAGLDRELEAMGIADLAHHVVNSAWEGVAKPERAIYRRACRLAGVAPERCLFVDDRTENTEAAAAIGMSAVPYRCVEDLRQALEPLFTAAAAAPAGAVTGEVPRRTAARPTW
ncbi:HAD family hydrolase [Streptomyces fragilis]|uniref:HAD-IA family hydrolase n=1 Tax=Streptomyces fragilis TaxID=67301 RepID=A0ABV2YPV2_9ACTN|nr:HAD-IA family hydrolase [Streptomyces fragilis]